jgi:hypothetical protein
MHIMAAQDEGTSTESSTEASAQGDDQGKAKSTEATTNDTISISQSEIDKRIGNAVHKARETMEADYQSKLKAEQAELEKLRLIEEGKHKEHAALVQAELDALKADNERNAFLNESRKTLAENDLLAFEDVLLNMPDTAIKERAESLKSLIDAGIAAGVAARLDTGKHITETGTKPSPNDISDMSTEEWAQERLNRGYTPTPQQAHEMFKAKTF